MLKHNTRTGYFKKIENDIDAELCKNKNYTPMTILAHVKSKSKCIYHNDIHHYLSSLYCNYNDKLRQCVNNSRLHIAHPRYQYAN